MGRVPLFVELYAGTASLTLSLLGPVKPAVAYMGSKRRYASDILQVCGLRPGQGAEHVVLVDAGPWGKVWRTIRSPGGARAVAEVLRSWSKRDPFALWDDLVASPPAEDPVAFAAQYLWIQARSASAAPVWWDGKRNAWRMGERRRKAGKDRDRLIATTGKDVVQRGEGRARQKGRGISQKNRIRCRGVVHTATIARRLEAIASLPWPRVLVLDEHPTPGHLRDLLGRAALDALARSVIYMDPPYRGRTCYAVDSPRAEVRALAAECHGCGFQVVISEAEGVGLPGWSHVQIAPDEWLTTSFEPHWRPGRQMELPRMVAHG